jgi:hypothetical protein
MTAIKQGSNNRGMPCHIPPEITILKKACFIGSASGCFLKERFGTKSCSQGCQIFLDTGYQNRGKCTKLIYNVRNGHKVSQMSIKYSQWP